MMKQLQKVRNLGPISAGMLNQIGIADYAALRSQDVVDTYILLQLFGYRVNKNMLWALYGAVNDIDWREIQDQTKIQLLNELEAKQND